MRDIIVSDLFLQQEGMEDSLSKDSFSIIKEPMGTYLIGYPFNKHADSISSVIDIISKDNISVPDSVKKKISDLESYGLLVLKKSGNSVQPEKVDYLYSIPSYGGGI